MSLSEFDAQFEDLIHSIYKDLPDHLQEVTSYLKTMVRYNLPYGKKTRGLTVVNAVKLLQGGKENGTNADLLKMALATGWAIEWLQASFLVHDDIMDQSYTRRGRPCWYLEASRVAGLRKQSHSSGECPLTSLSNEPRSTCPYLAVNDGIHLMLSCYQLLQLHCSKSSRYGDLVQLFLDTAHRTSLGQSVDCLTPVSNVTTRYSESRYRTLAQWKTSYYSFYLPVMSAILLTNLDYSASQRETMERILLKIGELFQAQDDYLDVYGDPNVTGKIGTDIVDGKCSWVIVKALQMATPQQREELLKSYGKEEPHDMVAVKKIYDELKMSLLYGEYENDMHSSILADISESDIPCIVKDVLQYVIKTIYKREK